MNFHANKKSFFSISFIPLKHVLKSFFIYSIGTTTFPQNQLTGMTSTMAGIISATGKLWILRCGNCGQKKETAAGLEVRDHIRCGKRKDELRRSENREKDHALWDRNSRNHHSQGSSKDHRSKEIQDGLGDEDRVVTAHSGIQGTVNSVPLAQNSTMIVTSIVIYSSLDMDAFLFGKIFPTGFSMHAAP